MGLYERFAARAVHGRGITFHLDGHEMASMDATFTAHATRFNEVWFLDQAVTESLAITELGGSIEWGVRLDALTQDPDGVHVTLHHGESGRTEQARVQYLAGCDGGHSRVRAEADR